MAFDLEEAGEELLSAAADGDAGETRTALQAATGAKEREALLSYRDGERWNALHFAANNGHVEVMEALVESLTPTSSSLLAQNMQKETPLHRGCVLGHVEVVNMLLQLPGLDQQPLLAAENRRSETPLHCAAHAGSEELIEALVAASSGKKQLRAHAENGGTPLHYAAAEGNPEAVFCLLRVRADPDAVDYKGRTFRDVAHPDVREALRNFNADENTGESTKASKLLELGKQRSSTGDHTGAKRAFAKVLKMCGDAEEWCDELPEEEEDNSEKILYPQDHPRVPEVRNFIQPEKKPEEKARECYETYEIRQDSMSSDLAYASLVGIAHCHLQLREFSACTAAASAALTIKPDSVEALQSRGLSNLERGQAENSVQDLRQAVSLAPNDAPLRSHLAKATEKGREARAKEAAIARRMLEISDEQAVLTATRSAGYISNAHDEHESTAAHAPHSWECLD